MSSAEIVNKVWNYTHVLRNVGVGYVEQLESALEAFRSVEEILTFKS